jgi:hypothetical protein
MNLNWVFSFSYVACQTNSLCVMVCSITGLPYFFFFTFLFETIYLQDSYKIYQ